MCKFCRKGNECNLHKEKKEDEDNYSSDEFEDSK